MKKIIAVVGLLMIPALFVSKNAMADGNYSTALVVSTTTNQNFLYQYPVPTGAGGILVSNGGGIFNWSNQTAFTNQVTGPALQSLTVAQIVAATAGSVGQLVYCSNCASASKICVSTAAVGTNDFVLSTGTVCQ